jgi:hypothetical protein
MRAQIGSALDASEKFSIVFTVACGASTLASVVALASTRILLSGREHRDSKAFGFMTGQFYDQKSTVEIHQIVGSALNSDGTPV